MEQQNDQDKNGQAVVVKRSWAPPKVEEVSIEALTLNTDGPLTDGGSRANSSG